MTEFEHPKAPARCPSCGAVNPRLHFDKPLKSPGNPELFNTLKCCGTDVRGPTYAAWQTLQALKGLSWWQRFLDGAPWRSK